MLTKSVQILTEISDFLKNSPSGKDIDFDNKLFDAVFSNIVFKASYEAYFMDNVEKSPPFKLLEEVLEKIFEESNSDKARASEQFIDSVAQIQKVFTFTSHPIFVINKDAMNDSKLLQKLLLEDEFRDYFAGKKKLIELSDQSLGKLEKVSSSLYEHATDYLRMNLTPKQESAMLAKFAENVFDAIPIFIDLIDEVHDKVLGYSMEPEKREQLGKSIQNRVWRDQDNKPDVTHTRISHSDEITAKVGMNQQYALQVVNIIKDVNKKKQPELYRRLKKIVVKFLNAIDNPLSITVKNRKVYIPDEAAEHKETAQKHPEALKELRNNFRKTHFPNFDKFLGNVKRASKNGSPFNSPEVLKILKEAHLERVDTLENKENFAYKYSDELHLALSDLRQECSDNLEVRMQNRIADLSAQSEAYGLVALVSENRQNRDELESAFEFLKEELVKKGDLQSLISQSDTALEFLEKSQKNSKISESVRDFLSESQYFYEDMEIKEKAKAEISPEDKDRKLKLDVLYTAQYYSNKGDEKRIAVIAETQTEKDFAIRQLFEEVTKSPNNRLSEKSKNTELMLLIENPDDIYRSAETIGNILSNPLTEEYQRDTFKIPQVTDRETGEKRDKTISDVKREKGLLSTITEYDYKTPVKGKIVVMFAGSDSQKGLGQAAPYILAYEQWKMTERAIEFGYDVDVKRGNGPHPARNSGEHFENDQTVQGIEANNSPVNFAYKTFNQAAHKMGQKYDVRFEREKGQVELGNNAFTKKTFEDFDKNPELAAKYYDRLRNVAAKNYGELYTKGIKGDENKNLMDHFLETSSFYSYSAFTSRAARPLKRTKAAAGVNTKGVRSITFANSNAALIPHLTYSTGDIFGGTSKAHAKKVYEDSKKLGALRELLVNQTTFGVVTANPDMSWKMIDNDIIREKKNRVVRIKIGEKEYTTRQLTKMDADVSYEIKNHLKEKFKGSKDPQIVEKLMDSILIAANMDRQYEVAATNMANFYKEYARDNGLISEKEYNKRTPANKIEAILKYLPEEEATRLKSVKDKGSAAMSELAEINQKVKMGELEMPRKGKKGMIDPDGIYDKIYENIAAVKALHEYTSPTLEIKGKAIDLQQQKLLEAQKGIDFK